VISSDRSNGVDGSIAIVAMAGRFPGAPDLDTYWRNIRDGVESITFFSDRELEAAGVPPDVVKGSAYVKARGILDDADLFDAAFFGYSPSDALVMDPQGRIFLETAWEALERAGYDPRSYRGLIGVYAGATTSSYASQLYQTLPGSQLDSLSVALGNELPFLTSRVSYKLDLKGPSYPVQTACSTSLVAVHLACQGLLNSECDLAIAGAVSIRTPQVSGYRYQQDGIFSPDGRCRPFDASAQGTLFSNGVGLVVLKRLDEALADRDTIHAVIRGSAINNDGSMRASFTAPGVTGQTNVIADALASAGIDGDTIGYVESHGTATPLGDAIEIQALTQAFASGRRQYCAIGSVKANIGHLDAAAGIAGLIKTVLALEHRQLPPAANFERPNPDIRFERTPFYVNTALADWEGRGDAPRRAGVSAFGFGGTNAHVVIEEAPEADPPGESRPVQLLTISAESADALDTATANLVSHLRRHASIGLPDAAYTLKVGRRAFRHRRAVVCRSVEEAARLIDAQDPKRVLTGGHNGPVPPVVFRFSGDTARSTSIARELYDGEAALRHTVDRCADRVRALGGPDPRGALFSAGPADDVRVFVVQYAIARLLISWGVEPAAFIGEGVGAHVAECLSGRVSLEEALRPAVRGLPTIARRSTADLPESLRNEVPIVLAVPHDLPGEGAPPLDLASLLTSVGALWLAGARIDWQAFYADERRSRVPLPTYPFERRRYALERQAVSRPAAPAVKGPPASRTASVADWFYAPVWTQAPLALPLTGARTENPGVWIVFVDACGVGEELAERLEGEGHEVVTVLPADRFARIAGGRFTIDPRAAADYERLIEEVLEGDRSLTGAVHAWGIAPAPEDGSELLECGAEQARVFGSVLLLVQALGQAGNPLPVRLTILTSGVHDVTGTEPLAPGRATILGLRHVIAQEHPHVTCKTIDVDVPDPVTAIDRSGAVLRQVLHDLTADVSAPVIAYRGRSRWVQRYAPLPLSAAPDVPARLRPAGVYLITGGLGDIGLAVARYLARTVAARLVLIGRSPMPDEGEWDRYLDSHPASDPMVRRMVTIRDIRARGCGVLTVSADVADRAQMEEAFALADRRFGRIDGVIHAAGLVGGDTFKPIASTDEDRWRRQFHPKVGGLVVLDGLLRERRLDFCLLMSSLSAVLGGLGYGAYASANVFLDAVARLRNRTSAFPWLSVNWDTWLRPDDEAALSRAGAAPAGHVMTAAEGTEALHRILSADPGPQIVVSTGDLEARLDQWIDLRPIRATDAAAASAGASALALPRPTLQTAYVAPDGDLERAITEAFRHVLGLDQVGIHDNFFELGGHSLKAIEVAARLQSELGADVRVTMFYEAPTAALLARSIDSRGASSGGFDDVDRRAENRLERLKLRRRGTLA
jgi:acyl transferase domain-containing protein